MPTAATQPVPDDADQELDAPKRRGPLPAVDDHIVMPETRYEILDGKLKYVAPAKEPHSQRHVRLTVILQTHAADGYLAACDLLTRVSEDSNIAPDGSIYREGIDPASGGRYLEELAFEVASAQHLADLRRRCELLSNRGVRGVYAIELKRDRVLKWDSSQNELVPMAREDVIEDPALSSPIPVAELLDGALTDAAAIRAYHAKGAPEMVAINTRYLERGREEGQRTNLVALASRVLKRRFGDLTPAQRTRVEAAPDEELEAIIDRAVDGDDLADFFGDS